MLTILLLSAAMAGGEPLDSLEEWVGSWTAQRQSLSLTVDEVGHYRMDLDHKGERCFLEGTLLVRDGAVLFGSAEEHQSHVADARKEHQVLEDLEAEAKHAQHQILAEVASKPKSERRYTKEGYTFVESFGGHLEVDLPQDHPATQALEEAEAELRHCYKGDDHHPHHWPLHNTTPRMFFSSPDRVVALFPDHNGKEQFYRFVRPGTDPVMEASGDLGGAWVARLGDQHGEPELWGELTGTRGKIELLWEDGCTERARAQKSSVGYTFSEHSGGCDHLGTYRRTASSRGGVLRLRENPAGSDLILMREDGL